LYQGKIFVDVSGTLKVGEFGLAASTMEFPDIVPGVSHAGLVRWMSPERFDPDEYTAKPTVYSDVWALGCTIHEVGLVSTKNAMIAPYS
jgi:serine/threonine protein kinase